MKISEARFNIEFLRLTTFHSIWVGGSKNESSSRIGFCFSLDISLVALQLFCEFSQDEWI